MINRDLSLDEIYKDAIEEQFDVTVLPRIHDNSLDVACCIADSFLLDCAPSWCTDFIIYNWNDIGKLLEDYHVQLWNIFDDSPKAFCSQILSLQINRFFETIGIDFTKPLTLETRQEVMYKLGDD